MTITDEQLAAWEKLCEAGSGMPDTLELVAWWKASRTAMPALLAEVRTLRRWLRDTEDALAVVRSASIERGLALDAARAECDAMRAVVEAADLVRSRPNSEAFDQRLVEAVDAYRATRSGR